MAATIKDSRINTNEKKPVLIDRVQIPDTDVNAACILPNENGFMTVSDDRYEKTKLHFKLDYNLLTKIFSFFKFDSNLAETRKWPILAECVSLCG
jgi:hypothetical protein